MKAWAFLAALSSLACARPAGAGAESSFLREQAAGLRAALVLYRGLQERGGWPFLEGPDAARLRERLEWSGDMPAPSRKESLERSTREALRRFQRRHGLSANGVLDAGTLAALNAPVETRVRQLESSLASLKALRRDGEGAFVLVNLAEQRLRLIEGSRARLSMRVIVGRKGHRTPVLDSRIDRIVLNPSWSPPPGPALEEVLLAARGDPRYLEDRNIRVLKGAGIHEMEIDPRSLDWTAVSTAAFPYRLCQQPGPANPLGRIKFVFSNARRIYLHDTPAKGSFGARERDLSLGCVRLERAMELAERLLRGNRLWSRSRLAREIASGATRTLWLEEPVAIHIVDWGAFLDAQGRLNFRAPSSADVPGLAEDCGQ